MQKKKFNQKQSWKIQIPNKIFDNKILFLKIKARLFSRALYFYLLTAAAGEKKNRDYNDPYNVIVVEKIAKTVIHKNPP